MPWPAGKAAGQLHAGATTAAPAAHSAAVAAEFAQSGLEAGVHVWVPSQAEVWRAGVVVGYEEAGTNGGGGIVVELDDKGWNSQRLVVPVRSKLTGGPPPWLRRNKELLSDKASLEAQDLGRLTLLHEAELLHALQVRFEHGAVYTYTGPMLLAVNPFRDIPKLYSYEQLRRFVDLSSADTVPFPHVYGVARDAYQGVWHAGASQTVLVSGESGAGKTETTKFVMRFLALAGAGGAENSMSVVERRVLQCIPLLEALGNAKTLRNDNSSRFGKYTELQFGRQAAGLQQALPEGLPGDAPEAPLERHCQRQASGPRLAGAKTHCYLLEKVRVVGPQEGERSFHVFYQVLAAARRAFDEQEAGSCPECLGTGTWPASFVGLLRVAGGRGPQDFEYLAKSSCQDLAGHEEAEDFEATVVAMQDFGIPQEDIEGVLAAILAVLYLGNITFRAPANNSEGSEVWHQDGVDDPLRVASELLGVEPHALEVTLCRRQMKVKDERSHAVITQIRSIAQAVDGRDALARHLYGAVFAYVMERVNNVLGVRCPDPHQQMRAKMEERLRVFGAQDGAAKRRGRPDSALPFVGVLDIFGFEFFESNSFEQLCINFTNELLQQYFNEVIFEHEAALYSRERVQWDPQDFPDNKAIVELLAGDGRPGLSGVLPMLDEECNITAGTSESWCRKLASRYAGSKLFQAVKQRQGNFIVRHFAGPVEYASSAFLPKNKDTLSADTIECMKGSSRAFLRQRFLEHGRTFGTQTAVSSGRVSVTRAKAYSVSSEFRKQLKVLMDGIRSTSPHFVRCIKPNPQSLANCFHRRSVVEQLRYQGVLEAIRVSRAGYPVRLRHRDAVLDYRRIAPKDTRRRLELEVGRGAFAEAAMLLFSCLTTCIEGLPAKGVQVGATQLFLKREAADVLDAAVRRMREAAALQIQTSWRRHVCQRRYTAVRCATIQLQAGVRATAARRWAQQLRRERAALRLQSRERGRRARERRRICISAAAVLQNWARSRRQRANYLRTSALILRLQRWFRRTVRAVRRRRCVQAAVVIQRRWRGLLGRREAWEWRFTRLRLHEACRCLVHRWRRQMLQRVRLRVSISARSLDSQSPQSVMSPAPEPFGSPIKSGGSGTVMAPATPPRRKSKAQAHTRSPRDPGVGSVTALTPRTPLSDMSLQSPFLSAEVAAASASLQQVNGSLALEAMALERLCCELQVQVHRAEESSGLANILRCCYAREG